ncbi:iron chelate uptake ABC transporter family permease subunit [Roseibium salinum]|nr:iron chelate uptake ABC transporter family permease subunit [Roseibium salinum]
MLAIAGVFLQRLTANPIASPEVLGISSGAAFGVLAALFIAEAPGFAFQAFCATAGALAVFVVLMTLERRSGGSGERLLYSGVAVGALLTAVLAAIIATGDPRARLLLQWMTGSTYLSDWRTAWTLSAIAALALCAAPLFTRSLTLLTLGDVSARATGVNVRLVRLSMLVFTCTLTAVATLAIGPPSASLG